MAVTLARAGGAALLALTLLFGATTARAEAAVSYSEDGRALFSFLVPNFWTLNVNGARDLAPPDGGETRRVPQVLAMTPMVDPTVWIGFLSPPGIRNLAEGRAYLRQAASQLAFEPKANPAVPRRVGGRSAEVISGTGNRKGKPIQFTIVLVQLPANRVAIAAMVAEIGTDEAMFGQLNDVLGSIRAGGG